MKRLICGDALEVLPQLGWFHCLIADPPDNIGLGYDSYDDRRSDDEYSDFLYRLIASAAGCCGSAWISFNARHVFVVGAIVDQLFRGTSTEARLFIQTFTFGQSRQTDCGNGYRPLLRLRRHDAPLYPDAIRVESARQRAGDKRAAPGGCVPLDHWPEFPRITGNCRERRSWHPTQLREAMIQRMVRLTTLPGDRVADVFSGTGTVLRAVDDRDVVSIEIDRGYCDKIAAEHGLEVETLPAAQETHATIAV